MKFLLLVFVGVFAIAGCRASTSSTLQNEDLKASVNRPSESRKVVLVEDPQDELQACAVYTEMVFDGRSATLSNWQYFDPEAFCTAVAIPEDNRAYSLTLESESNCGDTYHGTNGDHTIVIVDYSRALCEMVIPGFFRVKETRDGSMTELWSKDDLGGVEPQLNSGFEALLVADTEQDFRACRVYTQISFSSDRAELSNFRYIDPDTFCTTIAIPEDKRSYDLELIRESFCGDSYRGVDGENVIEITDYSRATCEMVIPGTLRVEETREGETTSLWSKQVR